MSKSRKQVLKQGTVVLLALGSTLGTGGVAALAATTSPTISLGIGSTLPYGYSTQTVSITGTGTSFNGSSTVYLEKSETTTPIPKVSQFNVTNTKTTDMSFQLASGLAPGNYDVYVDTYVGNNVQATADATFTVPEVSGSAKPNSLVSSYPNQTGITLHLAGMSLATGVTKVQLLSTDGADESSSISQVSYDQNKGTAAVTLKQGLPVGGYDFLVTDGSNPSIKIPFTVTQSALTVLTTTLPPATQGQQYTSVPLKANQSGVSWTAKNLPSWLKLNGNEIELNGYTKVPSSAQTSSFQVTATDTSANETSSPQTLKISVATPQSVVGAVTSNAITSGYTSTPVKVDFSGFTSDSATTVTLFHGTTDDSAYVSEPSWNSSTLSFNLEPGLAAGSYNIEATNGSGATATATLTIAPAESSSSTGSSSTGSSSTGSSSTGSSSTGSSSTGSSSTGSSSTGSSSTGSSSTGSSSTGSSSTGSSSSGSSSTGSSSTGSSSTGSSKPGQGSFTSIVQSHQFDKSGGTIKATKGSNSVQLTVPAGAFSKSVKVSISTQATDEIGVAIPQSKKVIAAFGVDFPAGVTPSKPVTLTILNPGIKAGGTVYKVSDGKLVEVKNAQVLNGKAIITFSTDPDFVITDPVKTEQKLPVSIYGFSDHGEVSSDSLEVKVPIKHGEISHLWLNGKYQHGAYSNGWEKYHLSLSKGSNTVSAQVLDGNVKSRVEHKYVTYGSVSTPTVAIYGFVDHAIVSSNSLEVRVPIKHGEISHLWLNGKYQHGTYSNGWERYTLSLLNGSNTVSAQVLNGSTKSRVEHKYVSIGTVAVPMIPATR